MGFEFPSDVRLKCGWEFDLVFRTGLREQGDWVRLFFVVRPGESTRMGVTVGRRVANAAGRSRGRRVLRESARRLLPNVEAGYWFVLSLRERGLKISARQIHFETAQLLRRAGLIDGGADPGYLDFDRRVLA